MTDVLDCFPALADIDEATLRERVRDCWVRACEDADVDDLGAVPWLPPTQRALDITDESLVGHVQDVVAGSRGLADALERSRGAAVDRDLLVAGAGMQTLDWTVLVRADRASAFALGSQITSSILGLILLALVSLSFVGVKWGLPES